MLKCSILSLTLVLMALFGVSTGMRAATTVTIPTALGEYINWGNADLTDCKTENSGASVGSTGAGTVISFSISNTVAQDYVLSFLTGAKNLTAELGVVLTDGTNNYLDGTAHVENTGAWTPSTPQTFVIKALPVGNYTLTIKVNTTTGSYAGNYGNLAFTPLNSYDQVPNPGTITLAKGSYNGPTVESAGNVGYVKNGGTASYTFYNHSEGSYKLHLDICRYNQGGTMNVCIKDVATGTVEVNQNYTIAPDAPASYTANSIQLSGSLSEGLKVMTLTFSDGSSYICNYRNVSLENVGILAEVKSVAIDGQTVGTGDDSDWLCQLPVTYTAGATTISVKAVNGKVTLTAVDGSGNTVKVTDNGNGTFTLPTPAANTTTTVTIELSAVEGATLAKGSYTLKLFHIGIVSITDITVGGVRETSLLEALNSDSHCASLSDKVFTSVPTVVATLIDGSTVTSEGKLNETSATYQINGEIGTLSQDYTLTVEGIHTYAPAENDETVDLKFSGTGKTASGTWSNGIYTLSTKALDGWENSSFKLNGSNYILSVPADAKVKQLIFKSASNNYTTTTPAEITSVSSDGATAYVPSKCDFTQGASYDIVVNIDHHTPGKEIAFTLAKNGQPTAWLELTVERVAIATAPVLTAQSITVSNNHAVVALTFDRVMATTTATIGSQKVTAEGGSSTLYFKVWNLPWSSNKKLVIASGAAKDAYGNANTADITATVNIGAEPVVEKAAYDYVVSTAEEFKMAVAAVNASNTSADAARKVIFIKSGDYDFGADEQKLTAYNVSLIGESLDGVVLHGNRTGISNPVLNLRDRSGFYLQDLTVKNDLNYGAENKGGVGVAIFGGNKTVMKNVRMLSNQDTQVTGDRAYFENCDIHGTVDFICGGGDNYYVNTNLVLEDRGGNVIVAPSTSATSKWGYVFQNCTIKAMDGAASVTDGSYNLGRPWQNEPRTYYLNTTMQVLPSDNGWTGMGKLPTHFYEYNSLDADGNSIDLSVRGNSPTSTNTYVPVLSSDEAQKFTVENVLSGTDSWLPTEQTVNSGATVLSVNGATLSWTAVDNARTYVIFKDGKYLTDQVATSYTVTEDGAYTVRTANLMGGLGATSNEVTCQNVASGIRSIQHTQKSEGVEHEIAYSLSGQRVGTGYRGIVVKKGKKIVN